MLPVKLLPQALTPKARPNLAILMIDSAVLLTTTVRDLCGRLHAAHLVPLECPILVVEVNVGLNLSMVISPFSVVTYMLGAMLTPASRP